MSTLSPSSVLVTGAGGNLGRKIIEALAVAPWCARVVGLDLGADPSPFSAAARAKLTLAEGDLRDSGGAWTGLMEGVDAVVHLAAENPDVDATWLQSARSFDMTVNTGLAALRHRVRRFVFASSNHVMGGYKDLPRAAAMGPGALAADLAPAPGTRWDDGTAFQDSTAYATAKLMGERFLNGLASQSSGAFTAVSLRIGWTQPGENRAATISHAGSVIGGFPAVASDEARRDLRWFRNMWLANDDLEGLVLAAVAADASGWPTPGIVVNAMSANRGMDWDIAATERLLGYRCRHDLYAEIGA